MFIGALCCGWTIVGETRRAGKGWAKMKLRMAATRMRARCTSARARPEASLKQSLGGSMLVPEVGTHRSGLYAEHWKPADVRYGSLARHGGPLGHVRFTPNSRHGAVQAAMSASCHKPTSLLTTQVLRHLLRLRYGLHRGHPAHHLRRTCEQAGHQ